MKRKLRKSLLILFACITCLFVFSIDSYAIETGDAAIVASGKAGESLTWSLDENGHFVLSGTGDYTIETEVDDWGDELKILPWSSYTYDIVTAEVNVKDITDMSYMFK